MCSACERRTRWALQPTPTARPWSRRSGRSAPGCRRGDLLAYGVEQIPVSAEGRLTRGKDLAGTVSALETDGESPPLAGTVTLIRLGVDGEVGDGLGIGDAVVLTQTCDLLARHLGLLALIGVERRQRRGGRGAAEAAERGDRAAGGCGRLGRTHRMGIGADGRGELQPELGGGLRLAG